MLPNWQPWFYSLSPGGDQEGRGPDGDVSRLIMGGTCQVCHSPCVPPLLLIPNPDPPERDPSLGTRDVEKASGGERGKPAVRAEQEARGAVVKR